MLSSQQIDVYLRDGILVVDDLLSHDEVIEARVGLASTLLNEFGVNVCDLEGTGINLLAASFNGAGAFFVSLRARCDDAGRKSQNFDGVRTLCFDLF